VTTTAARVGARVGGLLFACMVALATAEILFRIMLAPGVLSVLKATQLIAWLGNEYADDEIHRLLLRFKVRDKTETFPTFDPMLGWTARPRTQDNPLGIISEEPYTLDEARRWRAILFFGDSFTAGRIPTNTIPDQLERRLVDWKVLNFGVPGYGLDQIYLLLRSVIDDFDRPHVVVGIFYNDLDRLLFQVQASVKPWFELRDGTLVEHGVPIDSDVGTWPSTHGPRTRLYTARAARGVFDRLFARPWVSEKYFWLHPSETAGRRDEKEALARALVRAIKAECDQRHVGLSVVLFPYREHLVQEGWYEVFMRDLLRREGIEYLDLQGPLQRRMKQRKIPWTAVYPVFNHPSADENAFIAGEIAAFLHGRHGWPTRNEANPR
jgi:hypothetical protein